MIFSDLWPRCVVVILGICSAITVRIGREDLLKELAADAVGLDIFSPERDS
jgi:hypothetical protein